MTSAAVSQPAAASGFPLLRIIRRQYRLGLAYLILFILFYINSELNERMFTRPVISSTFNRSMTLAIAGMAQTTVVLTGEIHLSVGAVISLSNAMASNILSDNPWKTALAVMAILGVGALC